VNGVNGAVIAYGQTGAGKTFTMFGPGFDDPRNLEGGSCLLHVELMLSNLQDFKLI